MIPSWLQHLHGTVHGYWYYGCSCYECYAKSEQDMGRVPMSRAEVEEQDRELDRVQAMTPEERKDYFAQESKDMMESLGKQS